jgi:hypothetical protein
MRILLQRKRFRPGLEVFGNDLKAENDPALSAFLPVLVLAMNRQDF